MCGIFRRALKLISTPRAALLPVLQGLWWQVQLDQHRKGSPAYCIFQNKKNALSPYGWFIPMKQSS